MPADRYNSNSKKKLIFYSPLHGARPVTKSAPFAGAVFQQAALTLAHCLPGCRNVYTFTRKSSRGNHHSLQPRIQPGHESRQEGGLDGTGVHHRSRPVDLT
jgi:hypothetical protein